MRNLLNSLPSLINNQDVDTSSLVRLKGIKEKYYTSLNGVNCRLYDVDRLVINTYYNSGEVRGKREIKRAGGCEFIISTEALGLPHLHQATDKKFRYLDYKEDVIGGVTFYIYQIPKDYLIPLKRVALYVSKSRRASHYGGVRLTAANGERLFLYQLEYKKNLENTGRVLDTSIDLFDNAYVESLIGIWESNGYIYPRHLPIAKFEEISPMVDFEQNEYNYGELKRGNLEDIDIM